ncbi:MAG: hypothetical protein KAW12_16120 [Candidatus Aminicenantes bacterium]|nr:hypothetical protein [Candidatus Aminicenantes bacterium]
MQDSEGFNLEIGQIKEALKADVLVCRDRLKSKVSGIYASDLMSDVLAYGREGACLLTGLNTVQAVISSHMADLKAIVFLRGKKPGPDIRKFAEEKGIVVLTTKADMFDACIKIARADGHLRPTNGIMMRGKEKNITSHEFFVDGKDFASAGLVSTGIKTILKEIGYNMQLIRRVAISTYEGEMNVVMHAEKATVTLTASDSEIRVVINDKGKGIPDIQEAMVPGFSTATEEQRAMGFGAGMGLPNMKKNSDEINVTSEVGKGTKLEMRFFIKD